MANAHGKGKGKRTSPTHLGLLLALMLLTASRGASAATWTVNFGGCTFTGDKACPFDVWNFTCIDDAGQAQNWFTGNGAPLVRLGSCPEQSGTLDLSWLYTGFGITALPANVFQDMSQMT
jgi:hypothetical protein